MAVTNAETIERRAEPVASPEPVVMLRDISELRKRRATVAAQLAEAERDEAKAEARLSDFVRAVATGGNPRRSMGSPTDEQNILREERDSARHDAETQREALQIVDAEIARYEAPDRKAAAERQKADFAVAVDSYLTGLDQAERLADALAEQLGKLASLRAAMPGVLGAHPGATANAADDRLRMAERIEFKLRAYVDPRRFAWSGDVRARAMPGWREHEELHVVRRFDVGDLA